MKFLLFKSGGINEILLNSPQGQIYITIKHMRKESRKEEKDYIIADEENYLWKWFKAISSDFATLLQITKWSGS